MRGSKTCAGRWRLRPAYTTCLATKRLCNCELQTTSTVFRNTSRSKCSTGSHDCTRPDRGKYTISQEVILLFLRPLRRNRREPQTCGVRREVYDAGAAYPAVRP